MSNEQERILREFSQGRRDFIVDGLERFGEKGTNPFSGKTYGEMARTFNDFHPNFEIELELDNT